MISQGGLEERYTYIYCEKVAVINNEDQTFRTRFRFKATPYVRTTSGHVCINDLPPKAESMIRRYKADGWKVYTFIDGTLTLVDN